MLLIQLVRSRVQIYSPVTDVDCCTKYLSTYEGWNFNSGNYLFTTDTK